MGSIASSNNLRLIFNLKLAFIIHPIISNFELCSFSNRLIQVGAKKWKYMFIPTEIYKENLIFSSTIMDIFFHLYPWRERKEITLLIQKVCHVRLPMSMLGEGFFVLGAWTPWWGKL